MKLEGSLDAFSLPDIFQLLSFTKKTGGLHLASDGSDGAVFFAGGQVTGASSDSARQPLARRLIGSGAVAEEALALAVERAAGENGIGVPRALLEGGAVDADLLRRAATDQCVDAVFDLLRWRQGDFAFVVDEANPDDVGVALGVEAVLADAESRRESWENDSKVVPSPQTVLGMPLGLAGDPVVSREEWVLLALVDGRRTVAELVDLTGNGQYAVVSTLAALVQRGLLEVREDGADHVGAVIRLQQLLVPLEGEPFTPVVQAVEPAPITTDEAERVSGSVAAQATVSEVEQPGQPVPSEPSAPSAPESAEATEPAESPEKELVTSASAPAGPTMLGGAHVPGDVVPPRAEPFLPKRQADFEDSSPAPAARPVQVSAGGLGDVVGATAVALDPEQASVIERDPSVNRSLMLRLIAGVRGL